MILRLYVCMYSLVQDIGIVLRCFLLNSVCLLWFIILLSYIRKPISLCVCPSVCLFVCQCVCLSLCLCPCCVSLPTAAFPFMTGYVGMMIRRSKVGQSMSKVVDVALQIVADRKTDQTKVGGHLHLHFTICALHCVSLPRRCSNNQ